MPKLLSQGLIRTSSDNRRVLYEDIGTSIEILNNNEAVISGTTNGDLDVNGAVSRDPLAKNAFTLLVTPPAGIASDSLLPKWTNLIGLLPGVSEKDRIGISYLTSRIAAIKHDGSQHIFGTGYSQHERDPSTGKYGKPMSYFLFNYSSNGDVVYHKDFDIFINDKTAYPKGSGLDVLSDNQIIVIGTVSDTSSGEDDAFIARHSKNGDRIWLSTFGDKTIHGGEGKIYYSDTPTGVIELETGEYIVGVKQVETTRNDNYGQVTDHNLSFRKISESGQNEWTLDVDTIYPGVVKTKSLTGGVVESDNGDIYVYGTGLYFDRIEGMLETATGVVAASKISSGYRSFVCKVSKDGRIIWKKVLPSFDAIDISSNGSIVTAGGEYVRVYDHEGSYIENFSAKANTSYVNYATNIYDIEVNEHDVLFLTGTSLEPAPYPQPDILIASYQLELPGSTPLNSNPTDLSISASIFDENITAGTAVGTLSTTDEDSGDTHTYSLVSGTGDTDNDAFTIDDNQLKINTSPDYEVKKSYSIRLQTRDSGGLTHEKTLILNVNNIDEYLDADQKSDTVASMIKSLTITPFPLDPNQEGGDFVSAELEFADEQSGFDLATLFFVSESGSSYALNIYPSDLRSGNRISGTLIKSEKLDQGLEDGAWRLDSVLIRDKSGNGIDKYEFDSDWAEFLGSININQDYFLIKNGTPREGGSIDQEAPSIKEFSLANDTVNPLRTGSDFLIGRLGFKDNASGLKQAELFFRYPNDSNTVRAFYFYGDENVDGTTLAGTAYSAQETEEGMPEGTYILESVYAVDEAGNEIQKTFDDEDWDSFLNASGIRSREFAVKYSDAQQAPEGIVLSKEGFDEGIAAGSVIGILSTVDPDANDVHSYEFASGTGDTDNAAFTIDGDQLKINGAPDYETKSSYSIRVRTTDAGGLFHEDVLVLGVNNLTETPSGGGSDTTPPVPQSLELSTSNVDLSDGAVTITATTRLTDDLSGVGDDSSLNAEIRWRSPSGNQFVDASFYAYSSGNDNDAIFDDSFAFNASIETGTWTIDYFRVEDEDGNQKSYTATELTTLGLNKSIEVTTGVAESTMDFTGDGVVDSTDALLMMRHLVGTFPGDAITQGIPNIPDVDVLRQRIMSNLEQVNTLDGGYRMDIDGDGTINPLSDGLAITQYIHAQGNPDGRPQIPDVFSNPIRGIDDMQNHLKDLFGF